MFRRIWVLTKQTYLGFSGDNCSQHAAAISYYAIFSVVPLVIFTVSIVGLVLQDQGRRDDLANNIVDEVPLSDTEGRDSVENALNTVQRASAPIAVLSLELTLWTSSAMFGSIRRALNFVWRAEEHRPFFRAKLIDLAQVGVLGAVLLTSIILTGVLRTAREISSDYVGPLSNNNPLWELPPLLLPALLSFATFALLFRYVPAAHPRWRDAIPGAVLATVLFEALKNSFAFYVANFNNFDVVYGSLAGVLLFLLNTYLAANILLVGAELSRVYERVHAGDLDHELYPTEPRPPIAVLAFRAFKGLFVRQ